MDEENRGAAGYFQPTGDQLLRVLASADSGPAHPEHAQSGEG
jgi:hypothetical protein